MTAQEVNHRDGIHIPFVNTTTYSSQFFSLGPEGVLNLGAIKFNPIMKGVKLRGKSNYDLSYNQTSIKRPSKLYADNLKKMRIIGTGKQ